MPLKQPPGGSRWTAPEHTRWHVYAEPPFAGPQQVLAHLARYTHRVGRYKTMTLAPAGFIRRFMLHVLPKGFRFTATTACLRGAAQGPRRWHVPAS